MLKTAILNTLLVCWRAGRMLPKHLLKCECERYVGGRIGDDEFDAGVADLLQKNFIDSIEDDLSGDLKFFITDLGRTKL